MFLRTLIIIFLLGIVSYILYYKIKNKYPKNNIFQKSERFDYISRQILNKTFPSCKSIVNINSYGLYADGIIVCDLLSNLKASPVFYYEGYPKDYIKNGWVFVNLDHIDLDKFNDDSPQFILCKTLQAYNILSSKLINKNVYYTGFTSFDRYKPSITKDFKKFIHIAGKSPYKGTKLLIDIWSMHPEWPELTVVMSPANPNYDYVFKHTSNIPNIKKIFKDLEEKELTELGNSIGNHICSSQHEGFGHYIHEARSMANVVLYTDAPPLNETFIPYYNGIPIEAKLNGYVNNICPVYNITKEGLETAITKILSMNEESLRIIGLNARNAYLDDKVNFKERLINLIQGDKKIPKHIHYLWLSKDDNYANVELPKKFNKYIDSWKKHNPEFKFTYWSGEDIIKMLSNDFPQFINFYKNLRLISKCDFARFLIIYLYGGLYMDCDYICRKNISELIDYENYFVFEPAKHFYRGIPQIMNGLFASVENSNLIYGWIYEMFTKPYIEDVIESTGPAGLYRYIKESKYKVLFGNTCDLLSIDDSGERCHECKTVFNSFGATIWKDGSGWGDGYNKGETDNFTYDTITNPITNKLLYIDKHFEIPDNIIDKYNSYLNNGYIPKDYREILLFSQGTDKDIYFKNDNLYLCDSLEKLAIINSIPNIVIIYKN